MQLGNVITGHPLGHLGPLADWRQFVLATLEPIAGGKTNKTPRHYISGDPCNPHDSANWTTYREASQRAAALRERAAEWVRAA